MNGHEHKLLTKLFSEAKQRIRLKLLGLFILLVIATTSIIGIIEGSIRDAFFCLFILFLLFVCVGCICYIWESWKREIKRRYNDTKGIDKEVVGENSGTR